MTSRPSNPEQQTNTTAHKVDRCMTSIERSKKRLSFSAPVAKPKGCGQASQGSERHCWRKPAWLFGFGCQWQPIRDSRAIVWIQCYATKRRVLDNGRFLRHPSPAEPKDVESPRIVPSDRTLSKERGCARVCRCLHGEGRHRSISTFIAKGCSK